MDKAIHIQRGREHIIGRPWPLNLMVVFGIDPDDDLAKDFVDIFNMLDDTHAKFLSLKYFNMSKKEEIMRSMEINEYWYRKHYRDSIECLMKMLKKSEIFKKYFLSKEERADQIIEYLNLDDNKTYSSESEYVDAVSRYVRQVTNTDSNKKVKSIFETNIDELKAFGMTEEAYKTFKIRDIKTVGDISGFLSTNTFKPNKKLCITLNSLKSVYKALSLFGVNLDQSCINFYVDNKKKNMADIMNKYMLTQSSKQACKPSDRDVDITEDVINDLKDYINWDLVAGLVKMSPEFIEKHIDKISFIYLSYNRHLTESFVEKHLVDYEFNHNLLNLFFNGVISLNFINKHGTQDQLYYACKYMNNRSDQDWLREF